MKLESEEGDKTWDYTIYLTEKDLKQLSEGRYLGFVGYPCRMGQIPRVAFRRDMAWSLRRKSLWSRIKKWLWWMRKG